MWSNRSVRKARSRSAEQICMVPPKSNADKHVAHDATPPMSNAHTVVVSDAIVARTFWLKFVSDHLCQDLVSVSSASANMGSMRFALYALCLGTCVWAAPRGAPRRGLRVRLEETDREATLELITNEGPVHEWGISGRRSGSGHARREISG